MTQSNTPLLRRRSMLAAATTAAWGGLLPAGLLAQTAWPNRPVKIIDAFAPGGSGDVMARMVGNKVGPRLGQTFVVENRPGAGGNLGTDAVAKAPPDGYTFLLTATSLVTNAASGKKLPFDYLKDLSPIGLIATTPLVIVVPADSPFKTLKDMVDRARAKPNAVRYASSGVGSMSHITMELLALDTKVQMLHVPYRGNSLATTDLVTGQVDAAVGSVATYAPMLEAGKLRPLVATSAERSAYLPRVPTAIEAGFPSFVIEFWWGLMGPAGVPADVVRRMNAELNTMLAEPDTRSYLARFAATPKPGTAEELGRLNAAELARWSKVIKDANIQME